MRLFKSLSLSFRICASLQTTSMLQLFCLHSALSHQVEISLTACDQLQTACLGLSVPLRATLRLRFGGSARAHLVILINDAPHNYRAEAISSLQMEPYDHDVALLWFSRWKSAGTYQSSPVVVQVLGMASPDFPPLKRASRPAALWAALQPVDTTNRKSLSMQGRGYAADAVV